MFEIGNIVTVTLSDASPFTAMVIGTDTIYRAYQIKRLYRDGSTGATLLVNEERLTLKSCGNCLDPDNGVHAIDCPKNPRYQP